MGLTKSIKESFSLLKKEKRTEKKKRGILYFGLQIKTSYHVPT